MRRELAVPLPSGVLLDDVYLPLAAFFRAIASFRKVPREPTTTLPSWDRNSCAKYARTHARWCLSNSALLSGAADAAQSHDFTLCHINIGRLLLPHALVMMSVTSFGLHDGWREFAVGSQAVFYAFAAADLWVPEKWRLKSLTSYARTFLVLMTAAFCAFPIFCSEVWRSGPKPGGRSTPPNEQHNPSSNERKSLERPRLYCSWCASWGWEILSASS